MEDFAAAFSLEEIIDWLGRTSIALLTLASDLFAGRTESVPEMGLERLAWLAQHNIAVVRAGVQQYLRKAQTYFRSDPSLLLVLAESSWQDTRAVAVELLRVSLRPESLGLEEVLGLLDSNQVEVQNLGQEFAALRLAHLPTDELIFRLVQHPHPNMRQFALELVLKHLPEGAEALARMERFFRTALFDVWPQRALKERILAFLAQRGLQDEYQAAVAIRILSDVVRVQGRADFERALETLVRLRLAYPEVDSPLRLHG